MRDKFETMKDSENPENFQNSENFENFDQNCGFCTGPEEPSTGSTLIHGSEENPENDEIKNDLEYGNYKVQFMVRGPWSLYFLWHIIC